MLGRLATGEWVIDRPRSHLHGDVVALLPEVLERLRLDEDFLEAEVDLGHVVGYSDCVEVGAHDDVRLETRPGRRWLSRIVYGREAEPCRHVTVVLVRDRYVPDQAVLLTAYVGRLVGPEPGDPRATDESRRRWATRALRAEMVRREGETWEARS